MEQEQPNSTGWGLRAQTRFILVVFPAESLPFQMPSSHQPLT